MSWEDQPFALMHACSTCDCQWATLEGVQAHDCNHQCGALGKERFLKVAYLAEPYSPATITLYQLLGGKA